MTIDVKVTWHNNHNIFDEPDYGKTEFRYTVHTIVHGGTLWQWINTTQEEALAEFQQTMDERNDLQAAIEPQTADGYTIRTDRMLMLWMNPADEMNAMLAEVLGSFGEQAGKPT